MSFHLTPNDTAVLGILEKTHQPLSAYDILKQLQGHSAVKAPVQVYRALEKLISQKRVHKLPSLNAYIACDHPHHDNDPAFFHCKSCGTVTEFDFTPAPLRAFPGDFKIDSFSLEIEGTCQPCQSEKLVSPS